MTFLIDCAVALELLTEAVRERGERYVYPAREDGRCLYWHGGEEENEPGCLVGLALAKAGVGAGQLNHFDLMGDSAADLVRAELPGIEITERAAEIFQAAQSYQDTQKTWGEAFEAAKQQAEEFGIVVDRFAA